jgi:uncharacterized protein with PIN domain
LLLDEPLLGLDEFLRDLGWNTVKVTQGMSDDKVLKLAKANDYVLVSPDRRLVDRSRLQGPRMVDVRLTELARRVHETLEKDLGLLP